MFSYLGLYASHHGWLIGLAYAGTALLPGLAATICIPDWVARLRGGGTQ